jgi:hypothetical protein
MKEEKKKKKHEKGYKNTQWTSKAVNIMRAHQRKALAEINPTHQG